MPRDMISEVDVCQPVDLAKIDMLHELLALAIGDVEYILTDERYCVDMDVWHLNNNDPFEDDGLCHVCLAGSVIARRLAVQPDSWSCPKAFPAQIAWRLSALNQLRLGQPWDAICCMEKAGAPVDSDKRLSAHTLELNKWRNRIPHDCAWADSNAAARELLPHLRELHADLKEAGL